MSASFQIRAVLLVGFLALASCADEKPTPLGTGEIRWAKFPVVFQADRSILRNSAAKQDLLAAIAFWEKRAGKPLFSLNGEWKGGLPYVGDPASPDQLLANVVYYQRSWPFAANVTGKTLIRAEANAIQNAVVLINAEKARCLGPCEAEPGALSERKLIAHELGHFLGFSHTSDRADIMFPEILSGEALEDTEVNEALLEKLTS